MHRVPGRLVNLTLNGSNFFYLAVKNDISFAKNNDNISTTDATRIASIVGGIVLATIVLAVVCYRLRHKRRVRGNPVSRR